MDALCQAQDLRCDGFVDPTGIACAAPSLSWVFAQPGQERRQLAWRIQAAIDQARLRAGVDRLWDSGAVESGATCIAWGGATLEPLQRVFWQVQVRDQEGAWGSWSEPATFQAGPGPWSASWIGGFPRLRRDFILDGPVDAAMAFVAGVGMYELRINGGKVGDHELAPTHTELGVRSTYAAHDVTALVRPGANAIGVMLAPGWLSLRKDRFNLREAVTVQLHVRRNGRWELALASDGTWQGSPDSPIQQSTLYDGEIHDARQEDPGWDRPGHDAAAWLPVATIPGITPTAPIAPPIRVVAELPPQRIVDMGGGSWVVDFGRNLAGWCRLRLDDPAGGSRITLRYAELLNPDGSVDQRNLRSALGRDIYTTRPGIQEWRPRFTYHGFRYVQIDGWPGGLNADAIIAQQVRSDLRRTGSFSCSDETLTGIYDAMVRTQESNLHDKPTDCCARDERVGWMGGGQFGMVGLIYGFDAWGFYRKWLQDISDGQDQATGAMLRAQAPGWGRDQAMPMFYAYFGVTWKLWRFYGDEACVAAHYDRLKALHAFLVTKMAEDGLFSYGRDYGDWLAIEHTPPRQIDNIFWFHANVIMAELAGLLGREEERTAFAARAEAVRTAYNRRYYHAGTGFYGQDDRLTQTANAMPLVFGLVPPEEEGKVVANLLWNVVHSRGEPQLCAGYTGMQHVIEALARSGHADAVLRSMRRRTYPGWGFMLANGATTLWERWELMCGREMNAHNQFAQSASVPFFQREIAGLAWPMAEDGVRTFTIRPLFHPTLDWAKATLDTPWGHAAVAWHRGDGGIRLDATIPANTRVRIIPSALDGGTGPAHLRLPDGRESDRPVVLGSGLWECTIR